MVRLPAEDEATRIAPKSTEAPSPDPSPTPSATAFEPSADWQAGWALGQVLGGTSVAATEGPTVLRPWTYPAVTAIPKRRAYEPERRGTKAVTVDEFAVEYTKKVQDPAFREWEQQRAWALGYGTLIDPTTKSFDVAKGQAFWGYLGSLVGQNPAVAEKMTPEQYADLAFYKAGGTDAYEEHRKAQEEIDQQEEERNPISTSTSTSTNYVRVTPEAAEAAVDQLARSLLGRMASDTELARYRKQINAFLKANPSVSKSTTVSNSDTQTSETTTTSHTGASASDAYNALQMRISRGSEGRAYEVGKMFEEALSKMASRER